MTIYGLNMDGLGTDTRAARLRRALFGATYGFISGAAFVLMAAFIDMWLNPDLPIGVNGSALALRLPLIGLGLALVGVVTCWWHEAWQGLFSGAGVAAALTLIAALVSSDVTAGMKFIVLIFIILPISAMTIPVAYILRWLTERHAQALGQKYSGLRIAWLVILALALGGGGGYFMKASGRSVAATHFIHNHLQDLATEKNPLVNVAGVQEHAGMPYTIYPTQSVFSTEGFDVHVKYEDGYRLTCVVVLYPERPPFLTGCRAGK